MVLFLSASLGQRLCMGLKLCVKYFKKMTEFSCRNFYFNFILLILNPKAFHRRRLFILLLLQLMAMVL